MKRSSVSLIKPIPAISLVISWFVVLISVLILATASSAQVRYVSPTGTNTTPASATSWASATSSLQGAINSLSSGEVWVAQGIYKPTATTSRTIGFSMKNGVRIYGGFVGNEASLTGRPAINPVTGPGGASQPSSSTLSGDIGTVGNNTDNSYHVISNVNVNSTAVLDGFVITGGMANGGTGLFDYGGGMINMISGPSVSNCSFLNNSAQSGGSMCNITNSSPNLANCSFQNNSADAAGGGMYNTDNCRPSLTNCSFLNNSANSGGGIFNTISSPNLISCSFQSNTASSGGGIFNTNSSPNLTNCSFLNNSVIGYGGGMYNYDSSSPSLTNCSFQGNTATVGGGGLDNSNDCLPNLTNCVLFGNVGTSSLYRVTVSYSLLDASLNLYTDAGNNLGITVSPFASPSSTQLRSCSPAINSGNNSATALTGITTDLAGNPRIYNGRVDMGAYEYQGDPTVVTVTNPVLTTARLGSVFSQIFTASGGSSPYSFSLTSGSLPTGLSLATTGALSGTPTQSGSFTLLVQATDANGCVGMGEAYSLRVDETSASPDLICLQYTLPATAYGPTTISVVVDVVEINQVATTGEITLRIAKDPNLILNWEPNASTIGNRKVQNSLWNFSDADPDAYILITSQELSGGGKRSVGLTGLLNPGMTRGTQAVSAVVMIGGEVMITNNLDADRIDYFNK